MHKCKLLLLLILSLLLPITVKAQDQITLSSLQVQIWPEYDKSSVLVIYSMTFSASTTFPAALSLQIPVSAGEPNAVAARQADGTLYNIQYTRQAAGDWAVINFTTTTTEIQLEYYDPNLDVQDNTKHFQYLWPGDYAVTQFVIQVQQPIAATNMRILPSLGAGVTGSDGLTYYTQNIGSVPAGQTIDITVDYQKSTDALSAENLPVQPSGPIPQSSAPDLNVSTWLPWIVGILGAGLIIGGILWFWRTGRERAIPRARRRRARMAASDTGVVTGSSEAAIYCSQCGKRASPGDQFCRYCGTQIRSK